MAGFHPRHLGAGASAITPLRVVGRTDWPRTPCFSCLEMLRGLFYSERTVLQTSASRDLARRILQSSLADHRRTANDRNRLSIATFAT